MKKSNTPKEITQHESLQFEQSPKMHKDSLNRIVLWILFALIFTGLGAGGYCFFIKDKEDPTIEQEQTTNTDKNIDKFYTLLDKFVELDNEEIVHITPDYEYIFYTQGDSDSLTSGGNIGPDLYVYDIHNNETTSVFEFSDSTGNDSISKNGFKNYSPNQDKLIISHGCCMEKIEEIFDLSTKEFILSISYYNPSAFPTYPDQLIWWISNEKVIYISLLDFGDDRPEDIWCLKLLNLQDNSSYVYFEFEPGPIKEAERVDNKLVINNEVFVDLPSE